MNITDVGHMTDDAEGGEAGEDRMAVAGRRLAEAKKSGQLPPGVDVNPADPFAIARFYEARFKDDARTLGLKVVLDADADPTLTPRATDNVEGMKTLIPPQARAPDSEPRLRHGSPGAQAVYFHVRHPPTGPSGNTSTACTGMAAASTTPTVPEEARRGPPLARTRRHLIKWPSPRRAPRLASSAVMSRRLRGPNARPP